MELLIRQVTVVDPASPLHHQLTDIAIEGGRIRSGRDLQAQPSTRIVDEAGLFLAPGFVDLFADFCDPGQEHRETLESGAAAAAAGGYTDVLLVPNSTPCVHNKSSVEYITQKSRNLPVRLHPMGALTRNTEGKELAELYDMHASGAPAFTDGWKSVQSGGLLLKALQYVLAIDVPVVQLPDDRSFNPGGLMHEGIVSTQLGLPGRPALAEELMVARDIELVRYTGGRLHLTGLSAAGSVAHVRGAKKEGLPVTCSVTPLHLLYTEEDLRGYDTNLKLNPPLRTAADRAALRAGVTDGTIDCIAGHHLPQDIDHKIVEFEAAAPGALSLQTAFAAVCTALPELSAEQLVALFSGNARRIFGLPAAGINDGSMACCTIFRRDGQTTISRASNRSRSANSPFFEQSLTGQIFGIIAPGGVFLNPF
ncbi:MAG: dihydroorotase [Chitinophagaceae bacterium]|nr:MAG: dihydroorotase [Chitinophagaceae bacterium]